MRRTALAGIALLACSLLAACQGSADDPGPKPTPPPGQPVPIRFMVHGAAAEVAAYQAMVDSFNAEHPEAKVSLVKVGTQDDALAKLRSGDVPDVFLLSRRDLVEVTQAGLNQPLEELLDTRGVDFSDLYKRDSLEAFSGDRRLQCMPYGVSPMVIYYNTKLIDFEAMEAAGLPRPRSHQTWTFEQFEATAQFASKDGAKGVYIDPSLEGLMPFVLSGGGQLFDDQREPTSLALSSEQSRAALERVMGLLRQEQFTPTPKELREKTALDRFKSGQLGMIAGYRSLTPELRAVEGLDFDVMAMPTLNDRRTIGDVTGLCLAADTRHQAAAADFIVHAISTEAVSQVAEAGYLVPSNNEVAESDSFLQPGSLPAHPEVFNRAVRDITVPPLLESLPRLDEEVHALVYQLFYTRVIDFEELLRQIDEASKPVLAPEETPEPSGSGTTGPSPSATTSAGG